jgi:N-glycosylase/DNA lyase
MNIKQLKNHYKEKKEIIKQRLKEFSNVKKQDIFYELCFCILTPQSNAKKCWDAVQELKKKNIINDEDKLLNKNKVLLKRILKNRTRFYNNKTNYLIECQKQYNRLIKHMGNMRDNKEKREFLVKNVKGLGYKEASHFLRNIGHKNLAILDRHILRNLFKLKIINDIPSSLNKNNYLEIEHKFHNFSKRLNIPMDELDLLFWSFETGGVFK